MENIILLWVQQTRSHPAGNPLRPLVLFCLIAAFTLGAPYFDFAYMARWAAGPLHRRMSDKQRSALSEHLRTTFLSALARNLGSFAQPPPAINISAPPRGRSENEIAVYAKVKWTEGFTIQLEFRFYWSPDGWKIFDVAANGASAVGYYRRYYSEQLRRHGPGSLLSED